MKIRLRDVLALAIVAVALSLAALASFVPHVTAGLELAYANGQATIAKVEPGSAAEALGLRPGMVVTAIDERLIADMPAADRAAFVAANSDPYEVEIVGSPPIELLPGIAVGVNARAVSSGTDEYALWLGFVDEIRRQMIPGVVLGLVVLGAGWWWLATGRAGANLRRLAVTLPVATATPLLLLPAGLLLAQPARIALSVVLPLSILPLAIDLAGQVADRRARVLALAISAACAAGGAAVGFESTAFVTAPLIRVVILAGIAFVPGLFASRLNLFGPADAAGGSAGRLVESSELLLAGATPGIAAFSLAWTTELVVWPILLWLAALLAIRAFTLRPLVRLMGRTTLQRDAIVAATEAERARIAADIHDEALQDLTLLVRRLDAAGNTADAEAARQVAARLRAICGDLRLPVLDDLGVGPALEWLTERMEPLAGGAVYLERSRGEARLPAPVELAAFRVAQEALANAVKHGRPPIVVRYRSGPDWLELDVDDAGRGIAPGAAERAEQAGHFGLLNMAQRAEQVGATLNVGHRPGGGARVTLTWEAPPAGEATSAREATPARPAGALSDRGSSPELPAGDRA